MTDIWSSDPRPGFRCRPSMKVLAGLKNSVGLRIEDPFMMPAMCSVHICIHFHGKEESATQGEGIQS